MMGTSPEARREPNPILQWTGWGFLVCAAIAIGYGLWSRYGSGETLASVDVIAAAATSTGPPAPASRHASAPREPVETCRTFGPIVLTRDMDPIRAVLATGYTPLGASRARFAITMLDAGGNPVWDRRGVIGGTENDASFVTSATALVDFSIEKSGGYTFEVAFPEGSLDDLREARIELHRAVTHSDSRITWGFGLAALACLLVNLLSPRSESYHHSIVRADDRDDWREAA